MWVLLNFDWFMEIREITVFQPSLAHFKPVRKSQEKTQMQKSVK